jgi:hypothetical protein
MRAYLDDGDMGGLVILNDRKLLDGDVSGRETGTGEI